MKKKNVRKDAERERERAKQVIKVSTQTVQQLFEYASVTQFHHLTE